jgi:hypothetical protein
VDLETDPATGDIVYVSIETGEVRRFIYTVSNRPPSISISANPTTGLPPLAVTFSSDGTLDPDGDTLSFEWNFGDGSALVTQPNPVHTYATGGSFTATLTVRDSRGASAQRSVAIETGNERPVVAIESPADGTRFFGGEEFTLRASASDAEDGSNLTYSWVVDLHHEDHVHPEWFTSEEQEPAFIAESHGGSDETYSYEVKVTVRDTGGLEATSTVSLLPGDIVRGDGNADGSVNISDPIATLLYLFNGDPARCALAMDVDASGQVTITDAVRLLDHLFVDGPAPGPPYPACGVAANQEAIPCEEGCP